MQVYILEKNYGNPSVQQIKGAFPTLARAKAAAKALDAATGRTYVVYEALVGANINLEDEDDESACREVYRTTDRD